MNRKRIFIVEDEAINALLLKSILQKNHNVLGIAANGKDALLQINEKNPDLIIMDIKLEGNMSGIDVINELQKSGHVDHIYCTAYTDEELIEDAMKTGPAGIMIKPINISELKKMIG